MVLRTKRIYEDAEPGDGERILVDRLWPRGVAKEDAELDDWMKELAPSDQLREWFDHDPERWNAFVTGYCNELEDKEPLSELRQRAENRTVTLLYAAKDKQHNNAVALKQIIEEDA